ncbi:hypothetical protein VKT23_016571 [Stygiomarasmius scandens]|uniref:Uncharacterized protein n=1 Tax=Marasmiellus scandens TaxID=2682957 RepID=A0ABR1IUX1_9AGAR
MNWLKKRKRTSESVGANTVTPVSSSTIASTSTITPTRSLSLTLKRKWKNESQISPTITRASTTTKKRTSYAIDQDAGRPTSPLSLPGSRPTSPTADHACNPKLFPIVSSSTTTNTMGVSPPLSVSPVNHVNARKVYPRMDAAPSVTSLVPSVDPAASAEALASSSGHGKRHRHNSLPQPMTMGKGPGSGSGVDVSSSETLTPASGSKSRGHKAHHSLQLPFTGSRPSSAASRDKPLPNKPIPLTLHSPLSKTTLMQSTGTSAYAHHKGVPSRISEDPSELEGEQAWGDIEEEDEGEMTERERGSGFGWGETDEDAGEEGTERSMSEMDWVPYDRDREAKAKPARPGSGVRRIEVGSGRKRRTKRGHSRRLSSRSNSGSSSATTPRTSRTPSYSHTGSIQDHDDDHDLPPRPAGPIPPSTVPSDGDPFEGKRLVVPFVIPSPRSASPSSAVSGKQPALVRPSGVSARSSSASSAARASQRNNNSTTGLHPSLYALEAPELVDERSIQALVAALDTGSISEDGESVSVSSSEVNAFLDARYGRYSGSGTGPSRRSYDVRRVAEQEVEDNGEGEWEDEHDERDAANTTSSSIPIFVRADEQDPEQSFSSNQAQISHINGDPGTYTDGYGSWRTFRSPYYSSSGAPSPVTSGPNSRFNTTSTRRSQANPNAKHKANSKYLGVGMGAPPSSYHPKPNSRSTSGSASGPSPFPSVRVKVKQRRLSSINSLYRDSGYISLRKGDADYVENGSDGGKDGRSGGHGTHRGGRPPPLSINLSTSLGRELGRELGVGKTGQELEEKDVEALIAKLEAQSSLLEWEDGDEDTSTTRTRSMSVPLSERSGYSWHRDRDGIEEEGEGSADAASSKALFGRRSRWGMRDMDDGASQSSKTHSHWSFHASSISPSLSASARGMTRDRSSDIRASRTDSEAPSSNWSFHIDGVEEEEEGEEGEEDNNIGPGLSSAPAALSAVGAGGRPTASAHLSHLSHLSQGLTPRSSGYTKSRSSGATSAYWTAPDPSEFSVGERIYEEEEEKADINQSRPSSRASTGLKAGSIVSGASGKSGSGSGSGSGSTSTKTAKTLEPRIEEDNLLRKAVLQADARHLYPLSAPVVTSTASQQAQQSRGREREKDPRRPTSTSTSASVTTASPSPSIHSLHSHAQSQLSSASKPVTTISASNSASASTSTGTTRSRSKSLRRTHRMSAAAGATLVSSPSFTSSFTPGPGSGLLPGAAAIAATTTATASGNTSRSRPVSASTSASIPLPVHVPNRPLSPAATPRMTPTQTPVGTPKGTTPVGTVASRDREKRNLAVTANATPTASMNATRSSGVSGVSGVSGSSHGSTGSGTGSGSGSGGRSASGSRPSTGTSTGNTSMSGGPNKGIMISAGPSLVKGKEKGDVSLSASGIKNRESTSTSASAGGSRVKLGK